MQSGPKTKEMSKTCYQRPPLLWINTIGLIGNDNALMNVYSHFHRYGAKRPIQIVFAER